MPEADGEILSADSELGHESNILGYLERALSAISEERYSDALEVLDTPLNLVSEPQIVDSYRDRGTLLSYFEFKRGPSSGFENLAEALSSLEHGDYAFQRRNQATDQVSNFVDYVSETYDIEAGTSFED